MKYEKCLSCDELGIKCDGPNFLAMEAAEMGRWCNEKRKQTAGLTYDKIAAETGISKSAVHGFFNGTHADCRLETIRPIVKLITGGKWDDNACGNLSNSEKAQYEERLRLLDAEIKRRDDKIQHLVSENETIRKSAADAAQTNKERYELLKRREHVNSILGTLLGLCVTIIMAALVIDRTNDDIGFFWIDGQTGNFGAIVLGLLIFLGVVTAVVAPIINVIKSRSNRQQLTQNKKEE